MASDAAAINWSIQTPTDWAIAQLEYMGLPVTNGNIEFLVAWGAREGGNWNNTATYNPLNTTLQYQGSQVMSGGNTAGVQAYSSWQAGVAATAQTLQGYSQIMAALQGGNALNDQQAMGNDLLTWSGGGYSSIGPANTAYAGQTQNAVGGGTVGTSTTPVGGAGYVPPPPSATDAAALDSYINQYYPDFGWLLGVDPQVKTLIEQNISQGKTGTGLMALIEQTNWWKTTSAAVRTFEQGMATNPGEYSFNVTGSAAQQTLSNIMVDAAQAGVQINAKQGQTIALDSLKYGWDARQIQQAIGSMATYSATGQTNAGSVAQQVRSMANQYYQSMTPQAEQSWIQNIAAGNQTVQQLQAYLAKNAATKWTGYANEINGGMTMQQVTDNLRTDAAKTLEIDPNSIDFTNPTYSKILDYVPPDTKDGVHRVMTDSEMQQYLKGLPQYGYTQGARDSISTLANTIATTWGKL